MNLRDVHCLVTGGAGFIGSHLVDALLDAGAKVRVVDDLSRGRIDNIRQSIDRVEFIRDDLARPEASAKVAAGIDCCFHLAARVGGVKFMNEHPALMFSSAAIDHNILEACRIADVNRIVYLSSACVYPLGLQMSTAASPLGEDDALRNGAEPDGAYGWTKLMGELRFKAYKDEYGIKSTIIRPFNPYGPRESFDSNDSHVIPSLIRRAVAREDPFVVWGDGSQARDFLYVSDLVGGMLAAIDQTSDFGPFNIASGIATPITEVVDLVLELARVHPRIVMSASEPTGVVSRRANISRALKTLHWKPKVSLAEGLNSMMTWYRKQLGSTQRE